MGWRGSDELLSYGQKHAFDILEHVDVPNPDDAVATECEFAVADFVGLAFRVLAAVYFDDQAPLAADKVDVVASDRLLADEFESIELPIAKL